MAAQKGTARLKVDSTGSGSFVTAGLRSRLIAFNARCRTLRTRSAGQRRAAAWCRRAQRASRVRAFFKDGVGRKLVRSYVFGGTIRDW